MKLKTSNWRCGPGSLIYESGIQETGLAKSLHLGIFGIKMVPIVMRVEEIMRMSIQNEEDKGPLS